MTRFARVAGLAFVMAAFLFALADRAIAAAPEAFTYRGGGRGTVEFDHRMHASKGYVCRDCHTDFAGTGKQLFQTQKRSLIDRPTHDTDQSCFACHNDKLAFDKCDSCHRRF
ncbi:c(7)-type cytochrome triheme domain-containing protein [Telmatospirillum siberiense]|nr:c(7)-type cytochrome triheme domain-containing protein [Telmatospirillum siberiense]